MSAAETAFSTGFPGFFTRASTSLSGPPSPGRTILAERRSRRSGSGLRWRPGPPPGLWLKDEVDGDRAVLLAALDGVSRLEMDPAAPLVLDLKAVDLRALRHLRDQDLARLERLLSFLSASLYHAGG